MLEGLHEALLNGVLGILPIVGDVLSNSEEFAIVPPYESLEGKYVSTPNGMDKGEIVACDAGPCGFWRVFLRIH
jgi:hypothetical protein